MTTRVWLMTIIALILAPLAACAQGRFTLPIRDSASIDPGVSKVSMIVGPAASHRLYLREEPSGGAPSQAGGTYQVTSTVGGEIHLKFTVDGLTVGGGDARQASMLGLDLHRGDVVTMGIRLQRDGTWNLTVFDRDLQPRLERIMKPLK